MPVSKTELFTDTEKDIAVIGRALSHPARIRIIELMNQYGFVKNCELMKQLNLTNASVSNHIRKLEEARLVQVNYMPNYFEISFRSSALKGLTVFLDSM